MEPIRGTGRIPRPQENLGESRRIWENLGESRRIPRPQPRLGESNRIEPESDRVGTDLAGSSRISEMIYQTFGVYWGELFGLFDFAEPGDGCAAA